MDISKRKWWIRYDDGREEGPFGEDDFQERLRAGEFPLGAEIKSDLMDSWESLLSIVASDESFQRPSSLPSSMPKGPK
ncbi:MAG: hypothetical protein GY854_28995 [Deltaproteobacteria bacterium]|nr:hypothetical protein [Deltaproteobacteria bacterium]